MLDALAIWHTCAVVQEYPERLPRGVAIPLAARPFARAFRSALPVTYRGVARVRICPTG
jgi:hypothetical protein